MVNILIRELAPGMNPNQRVWHDHHKTLCTPLDLGIYKARTRNMDHMSHTYFVKMRAIHKS